MAEEKGVANAMGKEMESIVLGGGCFWCLEATFQSFRGVQSVESGYAGGTLENPTYDDVGLGRSGHAEVVRVRFDPAQLSLKQLLTIFFHAHDPTTKNRQGNDIGTQYRSIILYENEQQHAVADEITKQIGAEGVWGEAPIVTEIEPLRTFYRAEDYHQNYYLNNPSKGYCALVIGPKLQKVRREFHELLK